MELNEFGGVGEALDRLGQPGKIEMYHSFQV